MKERERREGGHPIYQHTACTGRSILPGTRPHAYKANTCSHPNTVSLTQKLQVKHLAHPCPNSKIKIKKKKRKVRIGRERKL